MTKQPFYVTTPIYYVNDVPHIGHAYTTIACDVLARYKRLRGFDVSFITGTDEHGQKIDRAAQAKGETPKQYTDKVSAAFRDLWKRLDISNDNFVRTTDEDHVRVAQDVFQRLYDSGDIYMGSYDGWYCTPCEAFFPEADLVSGNCPDCGRPVEWIKEESYFFRLSKYQDRLLAHIEANPDFIQPTSRRNEMLNFIKGGLEDLSVSRTTFKWGIPVPFEPKHVIYVWVDALSTYLTAIGYHDDPARFAKYWPADLHMMGKEIVRFHAVIWPAMLMSLGMPLPKKVFGHGWWTVEGEKMSKSKGNVVKPQEYVSEFGVDSLRYFLLREVPFGQDGDFSRSDFIYRINADLANDLGNLLSRTTAMINKFADGAVPAPGEWGDADKKIPELAAEVIEKCADAFDRLAFQEGLEQLFRLVDAGNKYIDSEAPWSLAKTEQGMRRLGTVLYNLAESLRVVCIAISPVITRASCEIWHQLGLDGSPTDAGWEATAWGGLAPGTVVRRGNPVFPRVDTKLVEANSAVSGASAGSKIPVPPAHQPAPSVSPEGQNTIAIEDFAKVELRVATVIEAERIAGSDKLLRVQMDLGSEKRQIVAGIAQHYAPEELVGKQVVVVANLKPAKLRGEMSYGMLLAASTNGEPRQLALISPERLIPPGSKVK
ncbi:MAG: methionine--tRNA ligase [Clostridia bacterium]|nr:methionine--tRNA ligase [Clostridia bacterium]